MSEQIIASDKRLGHLHGPGLSLLAASVLGTTGFSSYLALPIFLGLVGEARSLNEQAIGWIGSSELLGLLLGSLLTARLVSRLPARAIAVVGIVAAIVGQLATIATAGIVSLLCVRLLVGIGGGICYALAMACIAGSGRATRDFSLFGLGLVALGSLELLTLPWLSGIGGLPAVLIFLAGLHGAALLLLRWLAEAGPNSTEEPRIIADAAYRLGWISLTGTLVFSVGATSFWAYVERLGNAGGLSAVFVGMALNGANLVCIFTCLATPRLEQRWGAARLQLIALSATALIFATWHVHGGQAEFTIRTMAYYQFLALSQILQQSVLARTDPSGRQPALIAASQGAGFALGPIFGGTILSFGASYEAKLMAEAIMLGASALLFNHVYRRLKPLEKAVREAQDCGAESVRRIA